MPAAGRVSEVHPARKPPVQDITASLAATSEQHSRSGQPNPALKYLNFHSTLDEASCVATLFSLQKTKEPPKCQRTDLRPGFGSFSQSTVAAKGGCHLLSVTVLQPQPSDTFPDGGICLAALGVVHLEKS